MSRPRELANSALDGAFAAFAFAIGVQSLRIFCSGLVFTLREAHEFSTIQVGLAAFIIAALAFPALLIARAAGPRRALLVLVAVMALARAAGQFAASPDADLALAALGVAAFLPVPALALGLQGGAEDPARGQWRIGLLLGLALDTAIKGAFGTLDVAWSPGWTAQAVGAGAPAALLILAVRAARRPGARGANNEAPLGAPPSLLLGLWPLLFLEMLLFQNVAQLAAITGWPQWTTLTWVVAANAAAVCAARWAGARTPPPALLIAAGGALVLAAIWLTAAAAGRETTWLAPVVALAGHAAAALLLIASPPGPRGNEGRWTPLPIVAGGAGGTAFMALLFAYYAQYDIALGLPREGVAAAAALLAAAPALPALRPGSRTALSPAPTLYAPAMAAAMLLAPLALIASPAPAAAPEAGGWPVRVMTYNIHQGFDTSGRLGLEAIAKAVESEKPDIVALQEINRGWVIAGSVDTLEWLSRRLGMPYVYGPAADAAFGNAVLSRYPIVRAERRSMPNNDDLIFDRSYLWAEIDIGDGLLRVIATHFHHIADEGERRRPQTEEVVRRWGGAARAVLMGDLNAQPGSPELAQLEASGMADAFVASGSAGRQFTARSDNLHERIDYIWASPDLIASGYSARLTQASDHLPVAATISPR